MDNRKSSTYTAWNEKPGLYQLFVYNLKKKNYQSNKQKFDNRYVSKVWKCING